MQIHNNFYTAQSNTRLVMNGFVSDFQDGIVANNLPTTYNTYIIIYMKKSVCELIFICRLQTSGLNV